VAPRIHFATEVEVRFEELGDFVTEYSQNLSLTGMFLHTNRPHPPGSNFQFEFEIADGRPLIRGAGEVIWARGPEEAGDELSGMGIRFISLDSQSREMVRWLIERSLAQGGPAYEL
jgi:uncharacterized protein (TIGR02266 family)